MGVKISDLPNGGSLSETDVFPVTQGSVANKVTWATILSAVSAASQGDIVDSGNYTAVPASVGQINFSDTTGLAVGQPLKITQNSIDRYYIVTGVTTDTSITVGGPPLTLAVAITSLAISDTNKVVQVDFICPGSYTAADVTTTLLNRSTKSRFRWAGAQGHLVYASMSHNEPDTDSANQPFVNVSVNGTNVFGDNGGDGIELPDGTTWASTGDGTASAAEYVIVRGDSIELDLTDASGNQDARDLTVSLTIVLG